MQHLGTILVIFVTILHLIFSDNPLLECHYKIKTVQKIDFSGSKLLGATFKTIKGTKADSAFACAQECCIESTGHCSLGEYNPQMSSVQCLLLACYPLHACRTMQGSKGQQVAIINRTQMIKHAPTPTSSVDVTDLKLPSKSNSKTFLKPNVAGSVRNGNQHYQPYEPTSYLDNFVKISDSVFKMTEANISTVEKVKLGVQSFTNATTDFVHIAGLNEDIGNSPPVPNSNKELLLKGKSKSKTTVPSPIKHAKTFFDYSYTDKLKGEKKKTSIGSVINPPKDVNEDIHQPITNVTDFASRSTIVPLFSVTLYNNNSNNSKYLKNGTADETTNITQNKLLTLMLSQEGLSSSPKFMNKTTTIKISSNAPLIVRNRTTPANPDLPLTVSRTTRPVTPTLVHVSTNKVHILQQKNLTDGIHSADINVPLLAETDLATNKVSSFVNKTYRKSQAGKNFVDSEVYSSKSWAGIHLVMALVIGLLLLLTVVGLVIRRVHDMWQRRHYQRMDFLVDGMYNTVTT